MVAGGDPMRIAVLLGGVSSEREISLKSGRAVVEALTQVGHEVFAIDIVSEDIGDVAQLQPEAAFIALHGRFGEDGGVQAMLESAGIPFTGSDSQASRVAMDKMASKCLFISNDVPTPEFRLVMGEEGGDPPADAAPPRSLLQAIEELGLPLAVKPVREGSSLGVSVAATVAEAVAALHRAFAYGRQALLERFVGGREVTVGILGDEALPIVELAYPGRIFDYDAKYRGGATRYSVAPDLGRRQTTRIQELALHAHRALGCSGFSRVDLRLDSAGQAYLLEVNTIPGFTSRSLFPMAARAAGIEFPDLCDRIVRAALMEREQEKLGALAG